MFEYFEIPVVATATTEAEVQAVAPPAAYAVASILVAVSPNVQAVLSWVAASMAEHDPARGVFRPSAVSPSEPGRWVWSDWLVG